MMPCARTASRGHDGTMGTKFGVLVEARENPIKTDYGADAKDGPVGDDWGVRSGMDCG